jgi:predicted PurR-regulated permease PerM
MENAPLKNNTVQIGTAIMMRGILFVLFLWGLYYIRNLVAVVLFSIVIASAVEPGANWFERRRIPRVLAVLFIYFAIFVILGGLFYLIVPTFISEVTNFASTIPKYLESPRHFQQLFGFMADSSSSFSELFREVLLRVQNQLSTIATGFFSATTSIFGGVMSFLLMIILSFYLSVQRNGLENFLRVVTPVKYEQYILDLWSRSRSKIGLWIQGQILLGILVGVLVFLGLTILKIEYALTFALLAAVFELIPVFGPILSAIPPIAVAFLQSPPSALAVVALFVIIQQFENNLIYPLVVRKIVGVPPILVILSIVIGWSVGGFFGVLLAIPVATVLKEFLDDVAARKHVVF